MANLPRPNRNKIANRAGSFAFLLLCVLALSITFSAQKISIITPDDQKTSTAFAAKLEDALAGKTRILDDALSRDAFDSAKPQTPFNMTSVEAKKVASVIGCDLLILVRSATQRRSSFSRPEYYEAYAAIYVISPRSGRLIFWKLQKAEQPKPERAETELAASIPALANDIVETARRVLKSEIERPPSAKMEEVPDADSPESKNFKPPIPYRRIKPAYTDQAAFYDVAATVEMVIDLGADGQISRTDVTRWAGFGLDESVEQAVRSMNWRPAERNGKTLPMRFLVRYNFKRADK